MSKNSKIITIVVIVIVVIIAICWYARSSAPAGSVAPVTAGNSTSETAAAANGSLTTSPNDTSDASMNADMNSIDQGMNSMNSDAAASSNTN